MPGRTLLYIMSPSYSGSTLLTFLLARHNDISTVGELKASALGDVDKYFCSCGQLIKSCGFWADLRSRMDNDGCGFSLDRFGTHFRSESSMLDRLLRTTVRGKSFETARRQLIALNPAWRAEKNRILKQNAAMVENICAMQRGEVFLDGSKDPNRLLLLNDSGLWNLKVVFLIRDGRGVTNSYMNHVGVSMQTAAREWSNKCEEMEQAAAHFSERDVLRLRYEDLCDNAGQVLDRIFDFVGVDRGGLEGQISEEKNHILGNAMRLNSLDEIKLDEKWKRMLSQEDVEYFHSNCGTKNAEYGYSI